MRSRFIVLNQYMQMDADLSRGRDDKEHRGWTKKRVVRLLRALNTEGPMERQEKVQQFSL